MLCLIVGQTLVAAYGSNESDEAQVGRAQTHERQPPMHTEAAFRDFAESGGEKPPLDLARYCLDDAQVGVQRFTIATPQAERAFDEADCA